METSKISLEPREAEVTYESGERYFKETAFNQYLRDISPQLTQKEIRTSYKFMSTDEKGISLACRLKNDSGDSRVLLDYKPEDPNSARISSILNVSEIEGEKIVEHFGELRSRLNPEERSKLIEFLSKYKSPIENAEYQSLAVSGYFLGFFQDNPEVSNEVNIGNLETPEIFSQQQKEEVEDIVRILLRKIPVSEHSEVIASINSTLFLNYFDQAKASETLLPNFIQVLKDIVRNQTFDFETDLEIPKFSIKERINRTFETQAELEQALESLPQLEEYPEDLRLSDQIEYRMVNLSDVVGGFNMHGWEISTSTNRGLPNIFKNSKMFEESGYINTTNPISYIFYQGKYFAYGDGRHRTVALKLMGVDKIPAQVYFPQDVS